MRTLQQSLFWTLLVILSACTKPFHFKTEHPEVVVVNDLPANFKIPSQVWDIVEGQLPAGKEAGAEGHKTEEGSEKPKAASLPILYSSVKVFLTEKNPDVLKAPSLRIEFPRGGGQFDLSDFVKETPGTFFVGFEMPEEFVDGTDFKVLFVSQARKRKLEDRIFGAGCSQFLDITQKFQQMMQTEGIKANTTRQRHVTLLAGHYIFSVVKEGRIYLTQVTITDSKNRTLLCEAT